MEPTRSSSSKLCRRCGQCCWDWKGGNPSHRCEHLADDLATCTVWGRWGEVNREECGRPLEPHQAVDLPPDCGYVQHWREQGLI